MAAGQFSAGIHSVRRLLKSHTANVRKLFIDERSSNERLQHLISEAQALNIPIEKVRKFRLDDMAQGTAHQGVVAALKGFERWDEARLRDTVEQALQAGEVPLLLVLNDVQDPHNLGACLRTADATGVMAIVVARHGAAGLTPAVRKVASGGAESVPVVAVRQIAKVLDWLRGYGVRVVGTSDAAEQCYWDTTLTAATALVMGTESDGLPEALIQRCDALVAIPMAGRVESLNVSVAAALLLYETARQRRS